MPQLKSFDEDPLRYYTQTTQRAPSVTTVLKLGIPKPEISRWQANLVASTAADERERLATLPKKQVIDYLLSISSSARDAASLQGRVVHSAAEAISKSLPEPEVQTDTEKAIIARFQDFRRDFKPVFLESEFQVWNDHHGYAGTGDAIIDIGGHCYIADWKTSRSVWPEVQLQLAAYARADYILDPDGTKRPLPNIDKKYGLVLHLREEKYELHKVKIDDAAFDIFLAALDIFHWTIDDSKYAIGPVMEP